MAMAMAMAGATSDTETLKRSSDEAVALIADPAKKLRSAAEQGARATEATPAAAASAGPECGGAPEMKGGREATTVEGVDGGADGAGKGENEGSVEMEGKVKKESEGKGEEEIRTTVAKLGPKSFASSVDMFSYFHDLSRNWPLDYDVNKYEFLVLEDLIKKGHQNPENKIGGGIKAFQLRMNPLFYSRCYYIIREDGLVDDFSYRKCVDNISPLPPEYKLKPKNKGKHDSNPNDSGKGGRHGGGRGNRGGRPGRGNRGGGRRF